MVCVRRHESATGFEDEYPKVGSGLESHERPYASSDNPIKR